MKTRLLGICRALQRRSLFEFVTVPADFLPWARAVMAARAQRGRYTPRRRRRPAA